uniref:Uncharacterized protein n=1 Tax=Glossina palpalis gambiensis TaxID=67801 RepID=A0A1B0BYL3_9MUSC
MFETCEFPDTAISPRTARKFTTRIVACGPSPTGPVQIDIPNLESGLVPVEGSARVPPIDLLSVHLVNLASLNPAVGDKGRVLPFCDFALCKDKNFGLPGPSSTSEAPLVEPNGSHDAAIGSVTLFGANEQRKQQIMDCLSTVGVLANTSEGTAAELVAHQFRVVPLRKSIFVSRLSS